SFFFQAEDGIRDGHVTGVQTCALPIFAFYYSVEGRKRFVKSKPLVKYMLDRYLGWLTIICVVAFPIIFSRAYLDGYFFAWRIWQIGRASCRERVDMSEGAVSVEKKHLS